MVYSCPKCRKIYKHNGKWLLRHMIEVCHVRILNPHELVVKDSIDLTEILTRIEKLEHLVSQGKIMPKYHDNPIERIKQEEEQKVIDPALREYRNAFAECINDLKKILHEGMQLSKPKAYEPEVTEEMALKKLQEINEKNRKAELEQSKPLVIEQLELVMT